MERISVWDEKIDPIDYYVEYYEGLNPFELKDANPILYKELVRRKVIVPTEKIAPDVIRAYEREMPQAIRKAN